MRTEHKYEFAFVKWKKLRTAIYVGLSNAMEWIKVKLGNDGSKCHQTIASDCNIYYNNAKSKFTQHHKCHGLKPRTAKSLSRLQISDRHSISYRSILIYITMLNRYLFISHNSTATVLIWCRMFIAKPPTRAYDWVWRQKKVDLVSLVFRYTYLVEVTYICDTNSQHSSHSLRNLARTFVFTGRILRSGIHTGKNSYCRYLSRVQNWELKYVSIVGENRY